MLESTVAAMFSSSKLNCSAVCVRVPPVRITCPVKAASPTRSFGSNRFPVRTTAIPLISAASWSSTTKTRIPFSSVNGSIGGVTIAFTGRYFKSL